MATLLPAFSDFFVRKAVSPSLKTYLVDAMSYMALGLFASLLTGSILNTLGNMFGITLFTEVLWPHARNMMGPSIAVAVAYSLKAPPLVLFASTICGAAGAATGGPVGAFLAAIVGSEVGKLASYETRIDILVTPFATVFTGILVAQWVGPWIGGIMSSLSEVIRMATQLQPLLMGSLLAVIMGICLTLPISSAAIAIMLSMDGLAAGAATVGCAAQMVGFAVMSYRDNGWSGVFAQGLGTSMLQMPNIVRKPVIWLPPIVTSAILGPIAILVFKMENTPLGAGMGTSGFAGQLETLNAMLPVSDNLLSLGMSIVLLHIAIPAFMCWSMAQMMRQKGLIQPGDMKITLN